MSFDLPQLAKTPLLPLVAATLLAGCWTPPNADVRPPGPARVIQQGIAVRSTLRRAVVQSVDAQTRTLLIQVADAPRVQAYRASLEVPDLSRLHAGAVVSAIVAEELTVYVSRDGRPPDAGAGTVPTARILALDPSYRVLTLQDTDGEIQTFKVGLEVRLGQMQAGDEVSIQAPEIVSLTVHSP